MLNDSCKILGIHYTNEYEKAVYINWENIEKEIIKSTGIIQGRNLTFFQKAIIINSKVLAKAWYLSHVYPIPEKCARNIQKILFKSLWNSNYEPISRKTLYLPKCRGGCGLVNVVYKSKAILFKTFWKSNHEEALGFKLMIYYCKIKASFLLESYGNDEVSIFVLELICRYS